MMFRRTRLTVVAVAALGLLLAGCGGSHDMDDMGMASPSGTSGASAADAMFAQMMIPHHEQALELADMALDPTLMASEQVKALASQIKSAQDPEIDLMTQWLSEWDQPLMDMSEDHSMTMEGMLSVDEIAALGLLTGEEFDQAWVSAMIAHHKGAIKMADTVIAEGKSAPVQELANAIIQAQKSEIDTLELLLK